MRFEHILQIYWTKGLFFGGKLFYTNKTWDEIFLNTFGIGSSTRLLLLSRFEINHSIRIVSEDISVTEDYRKVDIVNTLNVLFSQINSVNNALDELNRLNIIRLYLIKSYRGKCHALGKPVRGQRTWSNAWNAYNVNKSLRLFISTTKRQIKQNLKEEKINYKMTKKKYATKAKSGKKLEVKKHIWF
jgi:ribosomal protein S13